MRLQALFELMRRYWHVFGAVWTVRKDLAAVERTEHECAFLPAVLELQDSPPHPAARVALWSVIFLLVIVMAWSVLGRIDVVAVAPGKLIVSNNSKVIQSLEPGKVKAIHVKDGQNVEAGQLLIELDTTITGADNDKNHAAWLDAKLEALRAQSLLISLDKRTYPVESIDPELLTGNEVYRSKLVDSHRLAVSQWQELQAKLSTIDADTSRKRAERAGVQEQVHKLEQTVQIISQRTSDYKSLVDINIVSRHDYLEKEQLRIEATQDLATQRKKLEELAESLIANQRQKDAVIAEFRRIQNDSLIKGRERTKELAQEVIKSRQHHEQTRLTAPVTGVVQQLAVHTVGGVVTAAQPLMVIVPHEDAVEVEVMLENKDIGFVRVDQDAAVKIETFNYTKYGLIEGKVKTVSLDAIQDEKRGLIYAARILLNRNSMRIDGKTVKLTPGMAVSAEIKTAKRRIIEYFLSPLIQYASESLRER